jgi:hypothetical protein
MRSARFVLISVLLSTLPACIVAAAAVAAGAVGYVQYEKNEAYQDFKRGIGPVWRACRAALDAQGYEIRGDVAKTLPEDATQGEIEGEDYRVRVERYEGDVIRVRVRIGTFDTEDNRRKARLLLEEVGKKL